MWGTRNNPYTVPVRYKADSTQRGMGGASLTVGGDECLTELRSSGTLLNERTTGDEYRKVEGFVVIDRHGSVVVHRDRPVIR